MSDTTHEKLAIYGSGTNGVAAAFKVSNAGVATQLGSNFSLPFSTSSVDKLDFYIDYQAAGTFTVYLNGIQVFTYSGDVTTDGTTTLTGLRLASLGHSRNFNWSEVMLTDFDTRSWNLQTLAPVANGNTHNFDTGSPAASNVNEITLSDATLDGSTSAGQIDQYTLPAIASGTYSIVSIGVSARLQKGSSGPSKMDLGVRSGGSDYWSSDQTLTTAWTDYQNWWMTDPNTSATWAALPTNIGLKSVT